VRRRRLLIGCVAAVLALAVRPAWAQALPETVSPSRAGDLIDRWSALIAEAATRFGISPAWIGAVMQAESGGRTELDGRPITSPAGAIGLMQVMPGTYAALRRRYGLGGDPYDPHDNVMAGAAYLRELFDRYGYPALFAAYNVGPLRLDGHLADGRPLPRETLAYLAIVEAGVPGPSRPQRLPFLDRRLFFPLGRQAFEQRERGLEAVAAHPVGK
jgi:soluble lytic murein transglycosylase-like protein